MKVKQRKGFTIAELTIVLAVIAILSYVVVSSLGGVVTSAKKTVAHKEAMDTLLLLNSKILEEPGGDVLPEGTVFESSGFYFVLLDGTLREIVLYEGDDIDAGRFSFWVASGDGVTLEDMESVLDGMPENIPINFSGGEVCCTDIGCLIDKSRLFAFAFYTEEAFNGQAQEGCCVYSGIVLPAGGSIPSEPGSSQPAVSYSVEVDALGCSFSGDDTASPESNLNLTITPDTGYNFVGVLPEVKIGGVICEAGEEYIWNEDGGLLIYKQYITDDITVKITAVKIRYNVLITKALCTAEYEEIAEHGEDFYFTVTVSANGVLPFTIDEVEIGGVRCGAENYDFNAGTGEGVIYGSAVTGNIYIAVHANEK